MGSMLIGQAGGPSLDLGSPFLVVLLTLFVTMAAALAWLIYKNRHRK
jgi:hypothetical protein